ncbi:MAG: DUF3124 domain-containing protein, partial [bacterium]|nr:DUF3124 domain-containing protein [bacterium]
VTHEPPAKYQAPDLSAFEATGASIDDMSITQSVYVPIYSHLYYDAGRPFLIESTLSIRNTDRTRPLYISSVRYYDTGGDLVTTHIDRLIRLKPLGTLDILVQRRDTKGGSGANFIVEWAATEEIEEPMIEAMMVGTAGNHGFSFSRSGKPLTSVSR